MKTTLPNTTESKGGGERNMTPSSIPAGTRRVNARRRSGQELKSEAKDLGNFIKTDPNAKTLAWTIVVLVLLMLVMGFFQTPRGQYEWNKITSFFGVEDQADNDESKNDGAGFECPEGIGRIEFDALGVMLEPYPKLQQQSSRYCFNIVQYQKFLKLEGTIEATEDKPERKISGLDWLTETVAYPNWPGLLTLIKENLQDIKVSKNMPEVGWIELPGYGTLVTPTPFPNKNQPGNTNWSVIPTPAPQTRTPTPSPAPTETPQPTPQIADIPTMVPATPMPNAPVVPTEAKNPVVATKVVESWQAMCLSFQPATSLFSLDSLPIWDKGVEYIEFRFEEGGLRGYSNRLGGNGPDAFKYITCVLQILDLPDTLVLEGGVTASWTISQVRTVPMFGTGDGISNGNECYKDGLWMFPCRVTYPVGTPTPTPPPLPTPTPIGSYGSFSDYVTLVWNPNLFVSGFGCGDWNGTWVTIAIGSCDQGHTDYVNLQDVAAVLDLGGEFWVGKCSATYLWEGKSYAEYQNSGVCFGPIQAP